MHKMTIFEVYRTTERTALVTLRTLRCFSVHYGRKDQLFDSLQPSCSGLIHDSASSSLNFN